MNSLQAIHEERFKDELISNIAKPVYFDDSFLFEIGKPIVKTGSRRFEVENNFSDYDYAILDEDLDKFFLKTKELGFECTQLNKHYSNTNRLKNERSARVSLDLITLNFITYRTTEALTVIRKLNRYMDNFTKSLIKCKSTRCMIFEDYIDNFMTNKVLGIKEIEIDEDEIPLG